MLVQIQIGTQKSFTKWFAGEHILSAWVASVGRTSPHKKITVKVIRG